MARPGTSTAILGVKGGSGCSLVSSLAGRLLSKRGSGKIAVVDGTPSDYSRTPSFLSLSASTHDLLQLEPYRGHLTEKLLEGFFSRSPEGTFYLPLTSNDQKPFLAERIPGALQDLAPFFDHLILDLSSFPQETGFALLESSERTWILSSSDPSSLASIRSLERRLLSRQVSLARAVLVFNQTQRDQLLPENPSGWAQHVPFQGLIPFLGEGLDLSLLENKGLPTAVEKALGPFLDSSNKKSASSAAVPTRPLTQGPPPSEPQTPELAEVHQLHQKLLDRLRRSGKLTDGVRSPAAHRRDLEPPAREILEALLEEAKVEGKARRSALMTETLDLAFGFGPLEPLLQDPTVSEIMVNGPSSVFVERSGRLEGLGRRFHDEVQLRTIIERILAPIGRRIDESQPYVDGRLPDGSRINAVIPPLSLEGPILTIRKFSAKALGVGDLVRSGALTQEAADFLGACVKSRRNIVVSGGTGSGKTTLLNILSGFIPPEERIITIEDSAELQLAQEHVVRLEARPANLEGQGRVTIRDLVINSLRMRPDRIVIGEVRGGEALDMLQAMNTGHDGSLTTAHANSPRDALSRLETMSLFSGLELPLKAIREQIARAVHLVVQQARLPDGKRGVVKVSEVQGMEGEVIVLQDLFDRPEGSASLVQGPFPPSFIKDLEKSGYHWPAGPNIVQK